MVAFTHRAPFRQLRNGAGIAFRLVLRCPLGAYTAFWRLRFSIRRPITLNQKIVYKMIWDRRPILTQLADKLAVRDYVEGRGYVGNLPQIFAVAQSIEEIPWDILPKSFVIKPNHGSHAVVLVDDRTSVAGGIPPLQWHRTRGIKCRVHPDSLDRDQLEFL